MRFEMEGTWKDDSTVYDGLPGSRLYATLIVGTMRMHAQAYELKYVPESGGTIQVVADPFWEKDWETIWEALDSNDPWDTVEINGRMYGIVIYPFCNGTEHTTLTRVK